MRQDDEPDIIESGSAASRWQLAPPAWLRHRRHRPAMLAIAVIAIAASVFGYRAASGRGPAVHPAETGFPVAVPGGEGVQEIAASGPYLYLATDYDGAPPYMLAAYNRVTGLLIRQVAVPAAPFVLHIGPAGSVWLAFSPDQGGGGPAGIWLLSPDLSRHSAFLRIGPPDLLPTSPDTALLATQHGLTLLRMPPPGSNGHATAAPDPAETVGGQFAVNQLAPIDGAVAAEVTEGYGLQSHFVIAGEPGISYGGSPSEQAGYLVAEDHGLWATVNPTGPGPLIRLDAMLNPITPPAIANNPVLAQTLQIWSAGDTVWAATADPRHALVCFGYRNATAGPVETIPLPGQPVALAATGRTVYVSLTTSTVGVTTDVRKYPIPARCS